MFNPSPIYSARWKEKNSMKKTSLHDLKQMRLYLHLANQILAWNSTKSAPLTGHYPNLQFRLISGFLMHSHISRSQGEVSCLVIDRGRGSQLLSRTQPSSQGSTNHYVLALNSDHRFFLHFNNTIKSQAKSKRAILTQSIASWTGRPNRWLPLVGQFNKQDLVIDNSKAMCWHVS